MSTPFVFRDYGAAMSADSYPFHPAGSLGPVSAGFAMVWPSVKLDATADVRKPNMRLIRLLIALICLAAGAILGALNRQPVVIDLGLGVLPPTSLGIALIVALLAGVLIGGVAISASVALPLRRRLARAERAAATSTAVAVRPTPTQET